MMEGHFRIGYVSHLNTKEYHSIEVYVKLNDNIIIKGTKILIKRILNELLTDEDIDNPDYDNIERLKKAQAIHLAHTFYATSVIFLPCCEGCVYNAPEQKDHMNPPYGCMCISDI